MRKTSSGDCRPTGRVKGPSCGAAVGASIDESCDSVPPDLAQMRLESEVIDLSDRWADCVRAGREAGGWVTRGSFLNMQVTLRDTRGLYARVSAGWSATDRSKWSRLTTDEARVVRQALDDFPDLAERCDDQLAGITSRVTDGRRVLVTTLCGLEKSFASLIDLIDRLLRVRRAGLQNESVRAPAAG